LGDDSATERRAGTDAKDSIHGSTDLDFDEGWLDD